MIESKILGEFGEFLAGCRLVSKGHKILRTRYRKWGGEIDIISTKNKVIYFNEIKTRIGKGKDGVDLRNIGITRHKVSKVIKCAQHFIQNEIADIFYTTKQFDAYFLEVVLNQEIKRIQEDVSTVSDLKCYFTEGKIRILATYIENMDREVFGCYGTSLISDKD
ncbi:MAG: YraN family protein [bacterium]